MSVNSDSLVPFIIMWGIPTFMVVRAYLKMNTGDKKSAINDFKSARFIFTIGLTVIGAFLAHLGFLFSVSIIEIIGLVFFALGGIFSAFDTWKKSKIKSVFILVLISVAIYLLR
ncbi:hypothetical protein [Niallia oryzisoli]|uniref:hypothetical protein n=1 Tax=Niallia oryzisoli TaxID=1737571 RepID=UPI0037369F80